MASQSDIEGSEILRLLQLADQIKNLDLDAELDKRRTKVERLVKELGDEKLLELKRKPPKKAVHWRTKKKLEREKYQRYRKPKRQQRKLDQLKGGSHGWWQYVKAGWIKQKTEVLMTEDEFTQVIWPVIEGRLPMFLRYDTSKGITLDNIWAVDVHTQEVLFDGKEHALKLLGYTV